MVTVRVAGEVTVPVACRVPPLKIIVFVELPSPSASVSSMASVPAVIVVVPVLVFVAVNVKVPVPDFVRAPLLLITPAMLAELPFVFIVPVPVIVTVRVDGEVIVPAASKVPPLKIKVLVALPSPKASVSSALRDPAEIVVVPE
jgi:hypothetical protein